MNCLPKLGVIQLEGESIDLDAIIPIDDQNISDEFARQASLYAYIATLAAQAEAGALDAKRDMEREEAAADQRVRAKANRQLEKTTEPAVKAAILLDKQYQDAQGRESDARLQHLLMKAVEKSLAMRADMLVSLGAHLRHEFEQTGMNILEAKERLERSRRSAG